MALPHHWYFDSHAKLGHAFLHPGSREATKHLLSFVERAGLGSAQTLELGCGVGATAQLLLRQFPEMHYSGIDRSGQMLRESRKSLRHFGSRANLVTADLNIPLPIPAASCDLVISESVTAICDSRKVLNECRRVLTAGGCLYLNERIWGLASTTETISRINNRCRELFGFDAADEALIGIDAWKQYLTGLGFVDIEFTPAPKPASSQIDRVMRIVAHLRAFLSADVRRLISEEREFAAEFALEWPKMENWLITARRNRSV